MSTPYEVAMALWQAHVDVLGGYCPINWLRVELAHTAFETADFHSMHGNNLGNIRGHGDAGSISIHGANEIGPDGKIVTGAAVEAGFAAYSSLRAGATALVTFLCTSSHPPEPNRFQAAYDAACAGDVATFCAELKKHGYFTADLGLYTRGVQRKLIAHDTDPMPAVLHALGATEGFPLS